MRTCATIAPGLAPVVRREARTLGLDPAEDALANAGWIAFDTEGPRHLARALVRMRTVHRLGVVLAAGRVDRDDPWSDLDALVDEIPVEGFFAGGPFAVRGHRTGEHAFTSMDVAAHVGDRLHDHLADELGQRPAVDLEDPDAIVRAHIDDDGETRLWLDLAGQAGLHRRGYRVYDHPAGMKASLAAGLLELADHEPVPFADPMAGGATLAIEAAWRALDVSPMRSRGEELSAWQAPILREHADVMDGIDAPIDDPAGPFVAGDHAPNHVEGARRNVEAAGLDGRVDTYVGDVTALPDHIEEAHLVASNPPYGIRSGEGPLEDTYADLLASASEVLASGGRVGLLTPKHELVTELGRQHGFTVRDSLPVQHGRLTIRLMVLG